MAVGTMSANAIFPMFMSNHKMHRGRNRDSYAVVLGTGVISNARMRSCRHRDRGVTVSQPNPFEGLIDGQLVFCAMAVLRS
jgi:hypothetical protein